MPRPAHAKTNHTAQTVDGWNLRFVRTQKIVTDDDDACADARTYPVILMPGLGSSGAYTFDLSPDISLADYLAEEGWDVWTIELRGNGLSDKPSPFSDRGRWWNIDDMCEKDLPCAIHHISMHTGNTQVHIMGHSMGGMILTALLAKGGPTAARVRSATIIGSSCFLEGSWWSAALPLMPLTRLMYTIPAGASLRLYSSLAFSWLSIRFIDVLYFWPTNVRVRLAKAVLSRNFSAISPGVIAQFASAFSSEGLRSAEAPNYTPYCDPDLLSAVHTPVYLICGNKDKMCPPQGAKKQFDMFTGSADKKLDILGPPSEASHYGHFDILMGKRVLTEVFPKLHDWLAAHDHFPFDSDDAGHSNAAVPKVDSSLAAAPPRSKL